MKKRLNNKKWEKQNRGDHVWWLVSEDIGEMTFSFDRETEINLFTDYPQKLTKEQKEIFDKEFPWWAEFFKDRS